MACSRSVLSCPGSPEPGSSRGDRGTEESCHAFGIAQVLFDERLACLGEQPVFLNRRGLERLFELRVIVPTIRHCQPSRRKVRLVLNGGIMGGVASYILHRSDEIV